MNSGLTQVASAVCGCSVGMSVALVCLAAPSAHAAAEKQKFEQMISEAGPIIRGGRPRLTFSNQVLLKSRVIR